MDEKGDEASEEACGFLQVCKGKAAGLSQDDSQAESGGSQAEAQASPCQTEADGREWLVVPKGKVITMPTPDRGTHLCETYGLVFCFITGDPSS